MLKSLIIKNIVLISDLTVEFEDGLNVLTGETGAGKSILLDALGLSLGGRTDRGLIRAGADHASVTAIFQLRSPQPREPVNLDTADAANPEAEAPSTQHPYPQTVAALMEEYGLPEQDTLLLRRAMTSQGKSKAFINDVPVSLQTLKLFGSTLLEIHGQSAFLVGEKAQRNFLDLFGGHRAQLDATAAAFKAMSTVQEQLQSHRARLEAKRVQKEYLEHVCAELKALAPVAGEEEELLEQRQHLKDTAKRQELIADLDACLSGADGITEKVYDILVKVEGHQDLLGADSQGVSTPLAQAYELLSEVSHNISGVRQEGAGPMSLEQVDDRLHELRRIARKHNCHISDLPQLYADITRDLQDITEGDTQCERLAAEAETARAHFLSCAEELHEARACAGTALSQAVCHELAPLRLEKADFRVVITKRPEEAWVASGMDHIRFEVKTNPGQPFGDMEKVASGGEKSRFTLALRVVAAQESDVAIVIFDEIDSGVGGAVASAIGERMARLGRKQQVLAITHAPQVAAQAETHFLVEKRLKSTPEGDVKTHTHLVKLTAEDHVEEIARMLSGDEVTDSARIAARALCAPTDAGASLSRKPQ